MNNETLNITGSGNHKLYTSVYRPEGTAIGIVHILHGMGEHSGRYDAFAKFLSDHGLIVYTHDHRNHGRSTINQENIGLFAKNESFETMVDDVGIIQAYIHKHEPDVPMTMLGHSMGSVILRRYLQKKYEVPDKAIIMGTLPRYNILSGGVMLALSWFSGLFVSGSKRHRFVNRLLNKSMTSKIPDSESDLDWLSYDKDNVNHYEKDPLLGFIYNKYFYNSFFKALITINKANEIAKTPAIKTLFISGYEDPLSKEMKAIHKLEKTYDKLLDDFDSEVKPVYKARHEVLNEENKEKTYDYLLDWILNR